MCKTSDAEVNISNLKDMETVILTVLAVMHNCVQSLSEISVLPASAVLIPHQRGLHNSAHM